MSKRRYYYGTIKNCTGGLSEVYVKGEFGYVVLMAAGENAVLIALARKDPKLGLVSLDMKRAAGEVAQIV